MKPPQVLGYNATFPTATNGGAFGTIGCIVGYEPVPGQVNYPAVGDMCCRCFNHA